MSHEGGTSAENCPVVARVLRIQFVSTLPREFVAFSNTVTVTETPQEHQARGIMHVNAVFVNGILTFPTHTRDNGPDASQAPAGIGGAAGEFLEELEMENVVLQVSATEGGRLYTEYIYIAALDPLQRAIYLGDLPSLARKAWLLADDRLEGMHM